MDQALRLHVGGKQPKPGWKILNIVLYENSSVVHQIEEKLGEMVRAAGTREAPTP